MIDIVSIVAGGASVLDVDLHRLKGYIIGVNESAVLLPHVDLIISMDRLWTEKRWSVIREMRKPTWLRRSAVQNIPADEVRAADVRVFECDHESSSFSNEAHILNGTNSGACALNLAYHMRPSSLYLLGFDMRRNKRGHAYWYPSYAWARPGGGTGNTRYAEWSRQFDQAAESFDKVGTKVFNVSAISAIASFPKITAKQYEELA